MTSEEKVFSMKFSKIYPLLVAKAERKGRTKAEVDEIIEWLTGYDAPSLDSLTQSDATYQEFFKQAPCMNPQRTLVTGKICGVRVEDIDNPLMRDIRVLDKLVDELARGRAMEKILRSADAN